MGSRLRRSRWMTWILPSSATTLARCYKVQCTFSGKEAGEVIRIPSLAAVRTMFCCVFLAVTKPFFRCLSRQRILTRARARGACRTSKALLSEHYNKEIMNYERKPLTEEEKKNNRFSFIVGMFIALAIIILFALLCHSLFEGFKVKLLRQRGCSAGLGCGRFCAWTLAHRGIVLRLWWNKRGGIAVAVL